MEGGVDDGGGQKTRGGAVVVLTDSGHGQMTIRLAFERKKAGWWRQKDSSSFCRVVPVRMYISKRTEKR